MLHGRVSKEGALWMEVAALFVSTSDTPWEMTILGGILNELEQRPR